VAALKRERDEAVEKMEKRKKAAERLVLMRTRRAEEQNTALKVQAAKDLEDISRMGDQLATERATISTALKKLGAQAEGHDSVRQAALIKATERAIRERNEARAEIAALKNEVTLLLHIKEVATKLVAELVSAPLKLGIKARNLLSQLAGLPGFETPKDKDIRPTKVDDPGMQR
jgi:hypothetical protein